MDIRNLQEQLQNLSSSEDTIPLFEYIDKVCHKDSIDDDSSSSRRDRAIQRKKIRELLEAIDDKERHNNICFFYDHRIEYKEKETSNFYDMLLVKCCSYIEFDNRYAMTIDYLLKKIIYLTEIQKYELLIHLLQNEKRQAIIPYFFTKHNIFWHSDTELINRAISNAYYCTFEKRVNRRHAQVIQYIIEKRQYIPIDRRQKEKIAEILEDMKDMEAWV